MPQGLSLSHYKAALFDVDGTLVDSLEVFVRGLTDTYRHYLGFSPERDELLTLCGIPLHQQMQMFQETPPPPNRVVEMVNFAIDRYHVHQNEELIFAEAVEALRLCRQAGLKTALVTSKNTRELEHFLDRFSAADFVQCTVCASDVTHPKPHPESAILACQRLHVSPEDAVMIGDSIFDLQCAKRAGVTPIAVGYGASKSAALFAESPAAFFATPSDLLEWVRSTLPITSCQERKQTNLKLTTKLQSNLKRSPNASLGQPLPSR
ncbi:MAG TPA: HAD-IA family hydrolase [Fimbriimonadaceae bacterium]|nr:HAD-IA family hydrolase [Fimbriimonadaceae bacterium]